MKSRTADNIRSNHASSSPRTILIAWMKLIAGLALIVFFLYVIAPLGEHIPGFRTLAERIDERNLRSAAIFYTDLEESGEGASYIGDCLEYPPRDD
jgi:hypothetical protein